MYQKHNNITRFRVPDRFRSFEEALRFEHLDLTELEDLELWQEERRVELALAFADRSQGETRWLLERLGAIRSESRGRKEFYR